jgi:uncharacterized protein YkwD
MRTFTALASLVAILALPTASSADPRTALTTSAQLQSSLLDQMNAVRASRGLARLRAARGLTVAAAVHSTSMARRGYFSHNSANGASFSRRIARFYSARGYRSWSVGENLLWASPDVAANRTLRLWLASPEHRANLLNPRWREVGLSAVHSTRAPGVYRNHPATVITADFGVRSR